jgi:hypothetical protein
LKERLSIALYAALLFMLVTAIGLLTVIIAAV